MANEAALVAKLEVRLDKFEKQMRQAGQIADKGTKDIEDRFTRSNVAIGSTIGTALGKGITAGIEAAINSIRGLVERFKAIKDAAELTGISLRDAFGIEKTLGSGGLQGFERVATMLDRMQRGEQNFLSKLFDANGVKNVRDAATAFDHVVDIIQRAPNLIQAREIGAGFNINAETVNKIREASSEFGKLRAAAAAAAPDLDRLAQLAKEFDDAWKLAIKEVKAFLVENFHAAAAVVTEFVRTTIEELRTIIHGLGLVADLFKMSGASEGLRDTDNKLKETSASLGEWVNKLREAGKEARSLRENRGPASRPPPLGGGGSGGSTSLDAFEREERRAIERAALMEREAQLVGATTEARVKALETLRLEQMANREGLAIDEARRAKIDQIAAGYAKASANLEAANREQARSQFFGNLLVDALDNATEKGAKLKDVLADVVNVLKRAALQALILGEGPFGGGKGSGLVGLIGGLLPKFQQGGMVPGTGPVPAIVHGGEMVVPKAAVPRVLAGATGSSVVNYNVDARYAQPGVAQQIVSALKAYDAMKERQFPARAARFNMLGT
jgi:hypothetical protein